MSYASLFFGVSGRFARSRYWLGLAMCLFLLLGDRVQLGIFAVAMPSRGFAGLAWASEILWWPLIAYVLFLFVTVHARRLEDMDVPGRYALLAVLTMVGIVPLMVICGFRPGTVGPNRFGPDPTFDPRDAAVALADPKDT